MKTKIIVTLKSGILDPQGKAVEHALHSLGFNGVRGVRIGKFIELELDGDNAEKGRIDEMCKKLLANPVTEDYKIESPTGK
ncbi:MAG: phosphoribosylformylglycinamidine synthase subunit PurS [Nitrospinae bacterium]|nr:phosphoribosylformylglycinamidine synthase subunit PurS [Nitrospinota bacterium]